MTNFNKVSSLNANQFDNLLNEFNVYKTSIAQNINENVEDEARKTKLLSELAVDDAQLQAKLNNEFNRVKMHNLINNKYIERLSDNLLERLLQIFTLRNVAMLYQLPMYQNSIPYNEDYSLRTEVEELLFIENIYFHKKKFLGEYIFYVFTDMFQSEKAFYHDNPKLIDNAGKGLSILIGKAFSNAHLQGKNGSVIEYLASLVGSASKKPKAAKTLDHLKRTMFIDMKRQDLFDRNIISEQDFLAGNMSGMANGSYYIPVFVNLINYRLELLKQEGKISAESYKRSLVKADSIFSIMGNAQLWESYGFSQGTNGYESLESHMKKIIEVCREFLNQTTIHVKIKGEDGKVVKDQDGNAKFKDTGDKYPIEPFDKYVAERDIPKSDETLDIFEL